MLSWDVEQVSIADAMIDRVKLRLRGGFRFPVPEAVPTVAAMLLGPRTLLGGGLPSGFRWVRDAGSQHRLSLERFGGEFGWLVGAKLTLHEPTFADPSLMRFTVEVDFNPTRVLSVNFNLTGDPWLLTRVAAETAARHFDNRHGNVLPRQLLHPGAPNLFERAGVIAQGIEDLMRLVLFRPHSASGATSRVTGSLTSTSIAQIECYWEFASPRPAESVRTLYDMTLAAANTEFTRYTLETANDLPALTLPLTQSATTKLTFYARPPDRVRGEVRYQRDVSRSARGSASGSLVQRFRVIAEDATARLNRFLRATAAHRRTVPVILGTLSEIIGWVTEVTGQARAIRIAAHLWDVGNIRAGDRRDHLITVGEAEKLRRRHVLIRRPVVAREPGGKRYLLASRFGRPARPGGLPAHTPSG